jgi:hypothetical protein
VVPNGTGESRCGQTQVDTLEPCRRGAHSTTRTKNRRRYTMIAAAFHKAGHAVAAVQLGGRVDQAVIEGENPRTELESPHRASRLG